MLIGVYTLSSVLCFVAACLMLARFNSASAGYAQSYLLVTILAAVLGGVDPFGGFGRISGLMLALAILQVISSGCNLFGLSQHLTLAIWGATLILVVGRPDRSGRTCAWRRGRAVSVVAVFDVGKTNAKLYAVAADGRVLETASTPNRTARRAALPPPRPRRPRGLAARRARRPRPRGTTVAAIVPCAHGGSGVLVGDDGPAMPMIDYEQPLPAEVDDAYRAEADGVPRARQRHHARRRARRPPAPLVRARLARGLRRRAAPTCTTPQYWAWRLSGVLADEVTSAAAQSHLWCAADRRPAAHRRPPAAGSG